MEKLEKAVAQVISAERELRGRISGEALSDLSDRVMRGCGTIMFADRIPSSEMLALYSALRLGSAMKLVEIPVEKLDEALFTSMLLPGISISGMMSIWRSAAYATISRISSFV